MKQAKIVYLVYLTVIVLAAFSVWVVFLVVRQKKDLTKSRADNDDQSVISGVETKGFDRQKYVSANMIVYGSNNKGISMDDRQIVCYDYDSLGYKGA